MAIVEVVEMVEIFSVYLVKDALAVLGNGSSERIDCEIFDILQKPKNKNNEAKRMITKD